MSLTRQQRRANIESALEGVRQAGGGVVSSGIRPSAGVIVGGRTPTGGTRIIVDVTTGKSAIIRETPEILKKVRASRLRAIRIRQSRRIERETTARTIRDLRKVGVKNIRITNEGIVGERNGRKLVVTRDRQILNIPKTAIVNPTLVKKLIETRRRAAVRKAILKAKSIPKITKEERIREQLRKATGTITATKYEKGLRGALQKLSVVKEKQLVAIERAKPTAVGGRVFRGVALLGLLGAVRGLVGVSYTLRHPIKAASGLYRALRPKNFRTTIRGLVLDFTIDPVGVVVEFLVYGKVLNLVGRGIKRSPVGRYVREELFIRGQPKEIRPFVRGIIKSSKVQEKINPFKIKSIGKVDFMEIKSLTKTEAKALAQTLRQTDSVIFGSTAARTLSKKRTPIPKDVDLATGNVNLFARKFIKNLPKQSRKNYGIRDQKLIRRTSGEILFDVKPLSRLIPQRSLFTRRGSLPVVGYVKKLTRKKGTLLPRIVRKPGIGKLEIPTQRIVRVKGIKLIGFGEQVSRKGLGTLQVLIEKSVRRAKDPQSFLISLGVQLEVLKKLRPKTPIGKIRIRGKIRTIESAIGLLKSKRFARLLERKVPGIIKQFPLLNKIPIGKLKRINLKEVKRIIAAKAALRIRHKPKIKIEKGIKPKAKLPKGVPKAITRDAFRKIFNKLPGKAKAKLRSVLPSKLPSRIPTRVFSVLPSVLRSKIYSKLRESRLPSRIPSKIPSRIPPSKIPSKIPKPSKIPSKIPSRIPSKLRQSFLKRVPSRLPSALRSKLVSKIPVSSLLKISKLPAKKITKKAVKKIEKKLRKKEKKILKKVFDKISFIYLPDMYSIIFGVRASEVEKGELLKIGRIFTGLERRAVIEGVRILKKKKRKRKISPKERARLINLLRMARAARRKKG